MLVEFVRQHLHFAPGRVVDLAGGVADTLIRRGVARPAAVAATPPAPPTDPPATPPEEPPATPPAPPAKKKGK